MSLLRLLPGLVAGITAAAAAVAEPSPEARLLSEVRQLTFEGRRAGEGYFGPDGRTMIFQSEREPGNPFYQMYVMDLASGETKRVSPGIGKTTCGWIHPDGTRVLFSSTHHDPDALAKQKAELDFRASGQTRRYAWDYDPAYDIWEVDMDGGTSVNLTDTPGYDAEGSFSPDGHLVAFASNRHAYASPLPPEDAKRFETDLSLFMDIYVMNADGTNVRRLTEARGYDGGPFFSPDGRKITWRHFSEDGTTAEIWTMNVDGSDKKPITHLGVMSWAPFFHPSGDYIVFATNRHGFGNFELYLIDADGTGEPVRVTWSDGFDGLPAFSPDGGRLSWTSTRGTDGSAQIVLATWNDVEARRLLGLPVAAPAPLAGTDAAITAADAARHVAALADPAMEGRLTGTEGERRATAYVAGAFQALGLEPAGDDGTYFQEFPFQAGAAPGETGTFHAHLTGEAPEPLVLDRDWRPLAFSLPGPAAPAEVVFAGYGIQAPATGRAPAYNAFDGVDVTDKWVMVLRSLPARLTGDARARLTRYVDLQYKAATARRLGARGLVVVSGPNAGTTDSLVRFSFDAAGGIAALAAVSVSDPVAERWLALAGRDLQVLQDILDTGEAVPPFVIPGLQLAADIDLQFTTRTGRNVLARLPAAGGGGGENEDGDGDGDGEDGPLAAVVIGAHVDHLGHGDVSNSLARPDERGRVHPGADDNASGVAALLEIAQSLKARADAGTLRTRRDIVFGAWSGEELGLLGSRHYVAGLAKRLGSETIAPAVSAYLNMDMVGRLTERLTVQGVASSPAWPGRIERANAPVGLSIATGADAYLSTDAMAFYVRGVPVLNAFTGAHEDYSTPRDTADKVNAGGVARVASLMARLAVDLAGAETAPPYVALERPEGQATRRSVQVYLGTIPEYGGSGNDGVTLSGTTPGSPAEKAGLKTGDVLVGLAGTDIANIYDFVSVLNLLEVGQPVVIIIRRGNETITRTVVPAARE